MNAQRVAGIAVAMLGVVVIFQLLVMFGAPWGEYTQGGGTSGSLTTSGRAIAALSVVVLCAMALGILARAGRGPMRNHNPRIVTVIAWFATVYSGLAIVVNLATPSQVERMIWAPFSIVMFVLIVIVMKMTHKGKNS